MIEPKQVWKTEEFVYDKITLQEFFLKSGSSQFNIRDKKFVFATQWAYLPDKFQIKDKPLIGGVIHIKVKQEPLVKIVEVEK